MRFLRYDNTRDFADDTLDLLLEHEVQNNLPISFILNERKQDTSNWLLATIKDDSGSVLLTAACTPPFNIVLFETDNKPQDAAVQYLSDELKAIGFSLPGVLAEQALANRFATCHVGQDNFESHQSLIIMRLDQVADLPNASGFFRPLSSDDLFFAPYWERAFGEECHVEHYDIPTHVQRIERRIGLDKHYFWQDGVPVSQAVHGRSTYSGAVVNGVYTPPPYRGRGYARSVVASLSQLLLERDNRFCCLFADAHNPISCGLYRKIGYNSLCTFAELKFIGKATTGNP